MSIALARVSFGIYYNAMILIAAAQFSSAQYFTLTKNYVNAFTKYSPTLPLSLSVFAYLMPVYYVVILKLIL